MEYQHCSLINSFRPPPFFHESLVWPPRSYPCSFCRREFRSAQALGGHMNVHRRDRAKLKQSPPPPPPPPPVVECGKDEDYFVECKRHKLSSSDERCSPMDQEIDLELRLGIGHISS